MSSEIVWVSAAGNYARRHWTGPYSASVGENVTVLEFENGDISNNILLFAGDYVTVQLRWDDTWAGASRDLDLWLWDFTAGDFVEYSLDVQEGRPGEVPSEYLSYLAPTAGWYGILVSHKSGSVTGLVPDTRVDPEFQPLSTTPRSRSISSPAESANPGMLAVGAAPWYDVHEIEPYSSRGPTRDGRIKPDVVGADCGATALEEPEWRGFCGTSQATAAHLAGMAALVRQRFPDMISRRRRGLPEGTRGADGKSRTPTTLGATGSPCSRLPPSCPSVQPLSVSAWPAT